MISGSNQQLQQQLEYTQLKPDYHSWGISKMPTGREDTLEERYAIKFCFKLGKNATETYGMLQTAFRPSCMNRASVFEWHKRFKESRESVRDDERCGRSKEVRTPELIGQIKNFMDNDGHVSIDTISAQFDISVGTVHTIIREELKMRKICAKFVPMVLREDSERKTLSWQQGDGRADQFRSRSSWCSGDLWWKLDLLLWPRDQETECPVEACWLSQTQEGQTEQIHPQTFDDLHMHWVPTGQAVNKEYYVEVLREFKKRFRRKRPALFKSGQWHFPPGQCTSPQLQPYHKLFDQDGHQHSSSAPPIVQTLLPVTFGYSLISEAVVMRQLRRWKRLWRRSLTRSHKRTSMGPSRSCWNGITSALQPEEITSKGTRVSCMYYQ